MSRSKTPLGQRIFIWVIAVVLTLGTIVGLIFMVWATQDSDVDPNSIAQEEVNEQYEQAYEEYQKQLEEERQKYRALDGYDDKVGAFDADSVKELSVETLKEGDGATISESDTVRINYTGWTPDGKIFESTKSEGEDANPQTFQLSGLIQGWIDGLTGKKVGGVYLLTIPSDLAYGETGNSDGSIQPNTPLRFLIEVISVEDSQS